jgi:hypothetical protein
MHNIVTSLASFPLGFILLCRPLHAVGALTIGTLSASLADKAFSASWGLGLKYWRCFVGDSADIWLPADHPMPATGT